MKTKIFILLVIGVICLPTDAYCKKFIEVKDNWSLKTLSPTRIAYVPYTITLNFDFKKHGFAADIEPFLSVDCANRHFKAGSDVDLKYLLLYNIRVRPYFRAMYELNRPGCSYNFDTSTSFRVNPNNESIQFGIKFKF